jgi:hypothetical protein
METVMQLTDDILYALEPGRLFDKDRVEALARKLDKAAVGHSRGEVLLAMCFLIHDQLRELTVDPEAKAAMLSAVMYMIDPCELDG